MIKGSLVALVTPMLEDGAIDWPNLDRLLDFHIDNGTHGIVAVGTTGESATLDFEEHEAVIKRVVDYVNGRIPVIAGTGANSTTEALHLTAQAKKAGADACLLVTPYYNKPTQEGLFQHFKKLAEAVDIPQILYNVPGRTACDMSNETALRLAQIPNIVGIKDATGNLDRGRQLINASPEGFAVYSGDDGTAVELMLAGGKGNISVTANVAPKLLSSLCEFALKGDADAARALQEKLQPLHSAMFVESNPIPVKWAMTEMGLISSGIRLPLTELSPERRPQVRDALLALDLISE
ncbi:4-hydroxy-tetrahydrodipicolinate synthase [Hahella sp. KA22]|uniref:4-hydroxy-tetrahydrodipicolinate synthase n=1 Tax=Hahella sp. KA22 TaxID=1628392 RepID=UPI000FDD9525|nr:4-hydroxy-tetrahydrodipicolinate synthase [Hahella sp. KA22]AZZ91208.1 4-hydroxy-tetrahydrodipicolinate synthase [Hahella sp. KA22]QAY54576.1 4-hydroxy-tetrahydrodipicolinate synthase [Hahella sp. KA22]